VIPKLHIESMARLEGDHEAVMGRIMTVGARLALELGADQGWRTIVNTGKVGRQEVYHLHVHFIGGPEVLPAMLKY